MLVTGKSIRSINRITAVSGGANKVKFVVPVDHLKKILEDIGFDEEPKIGDALVPAAMGRVTNFNANGKTVVRRDLPKELTPVEYYRRWTDWHGNAHSGITTREMEMYPRDYIEPPEETLHIEEMNNASYISSRVVDLSSEKEPSIIHLANIFLELGGQFEVVDDATKMATELVTKKLNWTILPPGKYPWNKTELLVAPALKGVKKSQEPVIKHRLKKISDYVPDFLATGRAGFNGYFVFGFEKKKLYVLESVHFGNATYVFGDDWESLSQYTKSEIINGHVKHQRVIHGKNWNKDIENLLA